MIEKTIIMDILRQEGYPVFMHEKTTEKIQSFHEQISLAFTEWVSKASIPTITVEGYSYEFLVNTMNMQPIGAFITLDWLLREPEKAKMALRQGIK